MRTVARRLRDEPAYVAAVLVAAINAGLMIPDWRTAVAGIAVSLTGGAHVRATVTPTTRAAAARKGR